MSHPNDQHVIPVGDGDHRASQDCSCGPRVDDGVPHPSGARVWIHRQWLDVEARDVDDRLAGCVDLATCEGSL